MKKFLKLNVIIALAIALIISQTACTEKREPVEKTSYYMDTICTISVYDMDDFSKENADKAIDKAFALCADYENLISITKEDSDIYKINHAKGNKVKCDPVTIDLIKKGIEYGDMSAGRFDITIGKVTDLWDFHSEKAKIPSKNKINNALKAVDYKQIKIDGDFVSMGNPEGEINLGAIGKGYIADKATEALKAEGVTRAIVNFGGNIVVVGDKFGDDFKIGIEKPFSKQNEVIGYVKVKDAVLVTSGIYERFIEVDGKIYHHIMDVNTGYSVDTDVTSVSIISEIGRSGESDALSTISLILGRKEGMKLIESIDGVEAVFIDNDGKQYQTSGLDNFVAQN